MKHLTTYVSSLLLWASIVLAQGLTGTVLETPATCMSPNESTMEAIASESGPERMSGQIWIVYSDRDNNFSTRSPENSTRFKEKIPLMEPFYVLEERGHKLHIIKDPELIGTQLSPKAEDWGWIEKERLLLWRNCLLSQFNINKKAMILNTISQIKEIQKGDEANVVEFKAEPNPNSKLGTGNKSMLYNFFFVYKIFYRQIDGRNRPYAVLLGKEFRLPDTMDPTRLRDSIAGWAPGLRITFWDHRIALEPDWGVQAAEERSKGKKAKAFVNVTNARAYRDGSPVTDDFVVWDADPLQSRMPGEWRRFPLLEETKEQGINIAGVMGQIVALNSAVEIDAGDEADVRRMINDAMRRARQINVVFVVDGTLSMGVYFPSVAKGIAKSMERLKAGATQNNFRFALAIYRDQAEGEEKLFERVSLGGDLSELLANGEFHDKDRDDPEALYYGLKNAITEVGLDSTQTNVIVVVGDAGNHGRNDASQVAADDVVRLLDKYQCDLLVYQTHDLNRPAYKDYITQLKDVGLSVARRNYFRYRTVANSMGTKDFGMPQWVQESGMYKTKGGVYCGAWIFPASQWRQNTLDADTLTVGIERFIKLIDQRNNQILSELQKVEGGVGVQGVVKANKEPKAEKTVVPAAADPEISRYTQASTLSQGIIRILANLNLSAEQMEILNRDRYQVYVPSPVAMQVKSQQRPLFKTVLLFSREELGRLELQLQDLSRAASGQKQRQALTETWIKLIQSVDGGLTQQQILDMTHAELIKIIFGLPTKSDFLKNVRLRDISNPMTFSDTQVEKYNKFLLSREKTLRTIFNSDTNQYVFAFFSNGLPYYCIDEDDLF